MEARFKLTWDVDALASAFRVKKPDIQEYLTDGRRVSFIIERRLKWDHPGWTLAPSEGAGYDLRDVKGGLWEVRSISQRGVYFNPSSQVGSGRRFGEEGFQAKLKALTGFILSDIAQFPVVDVYVVPVKYVLDWHANRQLGANASISRSFFLNKLLPQLPQGVTYP